MRPDIRRLIDRAKEECTTMTPRSLEALELAAVLREKCARSEDLTPDIVSVMNDLDDLLDQVEEERNMRNSMYLAGTLGAQLIEITKWREEFDKAPEPLRSFLLDFVDRGDNYTT